MRYRGPVSWGNHRYIDGGGNGLDPAVVEEIDVAAFAGSATIDITTVDGIAVDQFTHIQISLVDLVRSTTGSQMEMELRRQGGSFTDENYRWQSTSSLNVNPVTGDFELTDNTGVTTQDSIIFLSSVNQPCPTTIKASNLRVGESVPAFHQGLTTGAFVHDAIRFIAGASATWVSGTIVITGYRCKVGALYTTAFSGQSEVLIDLAPGEVIADVAFSNVGLSAAVNVNITVGTGDSYVTSGYRFSVLDSIGTGTGTAPSITVLSSGGAAAASYGLMQFYNLQTAAPVCAQGQNLQADGTDTSVQDIRSFILPGTTAYDQLRVATTSGTLNSGTLYIQTYKPRRTILKAQDLTGFGAANVDVTGLKKNNASLIVVASTDAATATNSSQSNVQFGTNSGFDAGASDYRDLSVDEGFDNVFLGGGVGITDFVSGGRTGKATLVVIAGLPQNTQTQVILAQDMTNGLTSAVLAHSGRRNATQVENRLRVLTVENFSAGTLYFVGYSL